MFLFSTDIDGTIYDGDATAARFAVFWDALQSSSSPPVLAYNTGRSLEDTRNLIDTTPLPSPNFIIAGVGTQIFDVSHNETLSGWSIEIEEGWDVATISDIVRRNADGIEMQPEECQNPHKCSWIWHERSVLDLEELQAALHDAEMDAQVVYSSKRDLDILPRKANKGNAVNWLVEQLQHPTDRVAVAGDSGNDRSFYSVPNAFGIVVANAEPALVEAVANRNAFLANSPCADGVIEGLKAWIDSDFSLSLQSPGKT